VACDLPWLLLLGFRFATKDSSLARTGRLRGSSPSLQARCYPLRARLTRILYEQSQHTSAGNPGMRCGGLMAANCGGNSQPASPAGTGGVQVMGGTQDTGGSNSTGACRTRVPRAECKLWAEPSPRRRASCGRSAVPGGVQASGGARLRQARRGHPSQPGLPMRRPGRGGSRDATLRAPRCGASPVSCAAGRRPG